MTNQRQAYKNSFGKLTFEVRVLERGKIVDKVTMLDTVKAKEFMNKFE